MPIPENEIDRIEEYIPFYDKMAPNMWYSFEEISEFIIGERVDDSPEGLERYADANKQYSAMTNAILFLSKTERVRVMIDNALDRGKIRKGKKNGKIYYATA